MSGSTTLGSATTYLEGKILGHTLAYGAFPPPAMIFVGLCTTPPSAGAGGSEIAAAGYARQSAAMGGSSQPNVAVNQATIEYPPATVPWGRIGWFELWDAAAGGNRLYQGTLIDPGTGLAVTRDVLAGDIVRLQAGTLAVRVY